MNISHNIAADIGNLWGIYKALSGKTTEEVLSKQSNSLRIMMAMELKALRLPAGVLKARLLARIASGKFITVRQGAIDQARQTRLNNWYTPTGRLRKFKTNMRQAIVAREIAIRVSGQGVHFASLVFSQRDSAGMPKDAVAVSRSGLLMSRFGLRVGDGGGKATFNWPGVSTAGARVVKGLQDAGGKPEQAIARGVSKHYKDVAKYCAEKSAKLARRAVQMAIRQ